jgi:hypothetical protein
MFNFTNSSGDTDFAPYLSLLGGGMTAGAQFAAGSQSASLLRANASIAGLQAQGEQQAGAEQAEVFRQRLDQTLGKQQAQIGGAGLTRSGSALRSLENTASFGAQDIARTQLNAARKAWGFDVTQQGDLARASMASSAGTMQGIGSLITSGARAYGQWSAT